ncbi:MAG: hypothetical protein JOZ25_12440 [Actinobacteria bacterium]|nr:hypothetical protein [Actinomycetota bacterium]
MRARTIVRLRAALGVGIAIALVLPGAAAAAPKKRRVETVVHSKAPDARLVKESYVHLYAPLPSADGPHPAACDWIGYLRFRDAHGPRQAKRADAVFVTMPGIFAGASMLDQFARNTVRRAAKRHRHVEVWTLDRRSNCLEDHWGSTYAARKHDYRIGLDYYYHGGSAGGRHFSGFKSEADVPWLSHVGLAQTVRDEYTVITQGMPRKLRRKKVFCGGHSLGGPLTAAFADWDFDGNPKTTRDAGYNQCAAYFALDTRLDLGTPGSGSSGGGGQSSVGIAAGLAAGSMGSPYVDAPPFTPETIGAIGPIGVAAFQQPNAVSQVAQLLPNDANFEATFRLLYSHDAANAITQMPSIRDFKVTNEVSLAVTFDDNSAPVTITRASLGTFKGGAVDEKSWPAPYNGTLPGGLIDGMHLMVPTQAPDGPLYTWWNYDKVGLPGTPVQVDHQGHPFTSRGSEVSDIRQFARVMYEAPADFAEQYFPTHLLADEEDAGNGDRSGDLQNLRYDGIPKRPAYYADAESGIEQGASAPPHGKPPTVWIKLPGYNHIDVASAAWKQNNGKPEQESKRLIDFALQVLAQEGGTRSSTHGKAVP